MYVCTAGRVRGQSQYQYMPDLKELTNRRPLVMPVGWMQGWSRVSTPLVWEAWESRLQEHPDRSFREYLVMGMTQGFRIGFAYAKAKCRSASQNMASVAEHPEVVKAYLDKEREAGRVVGPVPIEWWASMQISRFGVIPKPHQPGKWRLIVDLSHPKGGSVNDGIEKELCSLSYASVEAAVRKCLRRGRGCQLTKLDVEAAYRIVPVHPDDRPLLGLCWDGQVFLDTTLPFGLRSAPKIFNAVADGLHWVLEQEGLEVLHYLDDFLLFEAPEELGKQGKSPQNLKCARDQALAVCAELGVPVADTKIVGPVTELTFLGIELNTAEMAVRLPMEKVVRLRRVIGEWHMRKVCTKRELLLLIGQLQHACCVVRVGRTFLRRMIELSIVPKELHHRVRLNEGFRADVAWWHLFLEDWNGRSMMTGLVRGMTVGVLTTDASGGWGCGAFTSTGLWFQLKWPASWATVNITVKELLPVVMGVAVWGCQWRNGTVRCRCDNAAVVAILRSGTSRCPKAMRLMRCLFVFAAKFNVVLVAEHVPGVENGAADALSRDNLPSFFPLVQGASQAPSVVPRQLVQALVEHPVEWTSKDWRRLLKTSLATPSLKAQERRTPWGGDAL